MKSVAFFPSVAQMSENPYWPILASALEKSGIDFDYDTPNAFSRNWLMHHHKRINVLHLHYIHQFYGTRKRGRTRLLNVMRFAFNMILARALGFRTVFTLHNLEPTYYLQPAWVDALGHWVAANFSDRVIVHCREAQRLLVEKYGRRNHVLVVDHPNFISIYPNTISKETARKQLDLPNNAIVFMFFGGIRPNKGIETLIQAFFNLQGGDFRLVIAGKVAPPEIYAQALQDMAKGDERISFHLRFIPDAEIQLFLNSADIVVLPFAKILTSSSAMLAMSFGRPVIAPRLGCLPELIEPDAGWLFESNEPESLALTMQSAVASDLHQAGQRALDKVSLFTIERFATQTVQAYWD